MVRQDKAVQIGTRLAKRCETGADAGGMQLIIDKGLLIIEERLTRAAVAV